MCGRFALTLPRDAVARLFAAVPDPAEPDSLADAPRHDIRPTQPVETVALRDGARVLSRMRWGYLPHWYKAPGDGPLIINARSEEIAEKPAFRDAVRTTRCLVPASGFYEWRPGQEPAARRVHWLEPAEGGACAFAGVCRLWTGPDGTALPTVAIVTCGANAALAPIHHRMPVVVEPADWGLWLGEAGKGAALLMKPAREDFFRIVPGRGPGAPSPAQPQ